MNLTTSRAERPGIGCTAALEPLWSWEK